MALVSIREAARRLGVPVREVYAMIDRREVAAYRQGRDILVDVDGEPQDRNGDGDAGGAGGSG